MGHSPPRFHVVRRFVMSLPVIEGLENRQLLSATLVNGVLTVTGTAGADRIELERKGFSQLRVRENGRDRFFS